MAKLDDLNRNTQVKGLAPSGPVIILDVQWHGSDVVEVTYRDISGKDNLPFETLTNDRIDSARSGNALSEMSLLVARLDKFSRDEELPAKR